MVRRSIAVARTQLSALHVEEVVNSLTHGIGLALAVVGAFALIGFAALTGDAWRIAGAVVYAGSLVFLYAASTAYHGVSEPPWKRRLRRVDHFGVTLLIAGTYTPFVLAFLRGTPAFWMGATVWGLLALGVGLQLILSERRYYQTSLLLYLAMGFACVPFIPGIAANMPPGALSTLAVGGVLYVVGVVFFCWESLPYSHGIWHIFVLGGSGVHFGAVLRYAVLG